MHIRDANETDIGRLREIFRAASWSNPGDRQLLTEHPEFLKWSGDPAREGRTRLAERDGTVVGFVSTVDDGDAYEIEDLFVDPEHMRHGVASALIADVAALGRPLVVDANHHALAFYERAGFVVVGETALEHGTAHRMRRDA